MERHDEPRVAHDRRPSARHLSDADAAQNRYLVRVQAARSYGRNLVRIQRQNQRGVWVTTLRVQLNARGQKRFTGKFPHGVTKAQATVPKHPGYIAGFSTIKTIVR